mmetsp:Transcript_2891/g.11146  ORF Transcript_2891/g.11146 Transcript_2891/m.11146 type:complete len:204 (+) Transcript_2891:870-1481(+)
MHAHPRSGANATAGKQLARPCKTTAPVFTSSCACKSVPAGKTNSVSIKESTAHSYPSSRNASIASSTVVFSVFTLAVREYRAALATLLSSNSFTVFTPSRAIARSSASFNATALSRTTSHPPSFPRHRSNCLESPNIKSYAYTYASPRALHASSPSFPLDTVLASLASASSAPDASAHSANRRLIILTRFIVSHVTACVARLC